MVLEEELETAIVATFGGTQTLGQEDGWLIRAIAGGKTKSGVPVSEWDALTNTAIWACVTLIADVIAMLPIDVYRRQGERRDPQNDHPVAQLLNGSANDDMGAAGVVRTLQLHTLLWGNGYAEVERTRRGDLHALWPLLPDRTRPQITFPAGLRELSYQTSIHGASVVLPRSQVIHLMGYSFDGICGMSPIQVARNAVGLGLAMEEFGSKFFANDAKSGGFLMYPGKLGDKGKQNVAESFGEKGQGGLEGAHKVKILEEGMKFVPTTNTPEDSQFLGGREFQLAEAARIYRVSLVLLSSLQGSTVWGTGIEQLMIGFVTWTLGPWINRWEEELGRKLLTAEERTAGFRIKFNLNALLRGDMAARAAFYKAGITDGWLTRNEVRAKEDQNALPGLDDPLIQRNMQPASMAGEEEVDAPQPAAADDERAFRVGRTAGLVLELAKLVHAGDAGARGAD
jgi:HK97 family phage portal protein